MSTLEDNESIFSAEVEGDLILEDDSDLDNDDKDIFEQFSKMEKKEEEGKDTDNTKIINSQRRYVFKKRNKDMVRSKTMSKRVRIVKGITEKY
jgi:hypothetical protein